MSNIFSEASTQTPTSPAQEGDALTTKLAAITNESGQPKYANVDVALDALKESQAYIPNLQSQLSAKDQEIAAMREQIAKQQGLEEALARLQQPQQQSNAQPASPVDTTTESTTDTVDVNSLVQAAFKQHQAATMAEKNLSEVNSVLASKYGDKAVEHLKNKATELNTTSEHLEEMAKTNPKMAMQLLGLSPTPATPSFGGTNTTAWPTQEAPKLEAPKKSLLAGAKHSDLNDFMKQVQAEVYREHGITA